MLVRNSQAFSYKELLQHRKYSEKKIKKLRDRKMFVRNSQTFFFKDFAFFFSANILYLGFPKELLWEIESIAKKNKKIKQQKVFVRKSHKYKENLTEQNKMREKRLLFSAEI